MGDRKVVMLDMETLSTKTNPSILSIGAVVFDPDGDLTLEALRASPTFYVVTDGSGQANLGLDVDFPTIQWWMTQSAEARLAIFGDVPRVSLSAALRQFTAWYAEHAPGCEVWSYGAAADIPWLQSAYEHLGLIFPVSYRDARCLRTLAAVIGIERPEVDATAATEHNALDDALVQAIWLQQCFRKLGAGGQ